MSSLAAPVGANNVVRMRLNSHTTLATKMALLAALLILLPSAWSRTKYKVLHNFGASGDGTTPLGPPARRKNGVLYGTTFGGGAGQCDCGTVFELTHQADGTWSEDILHNFTAGSDGSNPWGGVIFDRSGNLYGTIDGDLSYAVGGVFELSPGSNGWNMNLIYTGFNGDTGPGVLMDASGDLYGAIGPGEDDAGAIGELSSGNWNYSQLYSFCQEEYCEDGFAPQGPPIWDRHGNLYGTTYYGGLHDCYCGVVFQMSPHGDGTWSYHILHYFGSSATDGERPAAGLVMDADGNLYGNTAFGGAYNQGTIFKFTHTGGRWKESVLYDFPNCAKGCLPGGTMVFDKAGNLYGVSSGGQPDCGGYTCGVVFKMTPQKNGKWKYSVVHAFDGTDGDSPVAVILDSKGDIFGTTSSGGTYNWGVAFEITP